MNEKLMCYDVFNPLLESTFNFPNVKDYVVDDASRCDIDLLSYRRDLGDYKEKLRKCLETDFSMSGYETLERIEKNMDYERKWFEKLKFKNFINPLSKIKENFSEKAVPFMCYVAVPATGIPATYAESNNLRGPIFLITSILIPSMIEVERRLAIHDAKNNIEKSERSSQNHKNLLLSNVVSGKADLNVDIVTVEPAELFMEKIKDPHVLPYTDLNKVNQKLIEFYRHYATQPKT